MTPSQSTAALPDRGLMSTRFEPLFSLLGSCLLPVERGHLVRQRAQHAQSRRGIALKKFALRAQADRMSVIRLPLVMFQLNKAHHDLAFAFDGRLFPA